MPQYALAIVLGSMLALYGNELQETFWLASLPILLLLAALNPGYRFILLLAAAYLWSSASFYHHLDHRLVAGYDHKVTMLRGTVSGIPKVKRGRTRFGLTNLQIEGYPGSMPRLLQLAWYQNEVVPLPGEQWQFMVKLKQPRASLNFAGFDFERWQFVRGIDATGYVRNSKHNRKLESAAWNNLDHWRNRLAMDIDIACSGCEHRGLIKALALGFRADIAASRKRLLQATGTAHLLAISGLHIGLVAWLFYSLGRFCWRLGLYRTGLNRMQLALGSAFLAALGYAALAGFSLPTVRALIMFSVVLSAMLGSNRINLIQSVSMAVILIVVIDPRALGSPSFWLSFSALLVIAFARFRMPEKISWWLQLVVLQCFFSLLFAPVSILVFGQFSSAGLLANIVAIPLVSIAVLPLVLAGSLLLLSNAGGAHYLFTLADGLLGFLFEYLDLLVDSGLQSIAANYPSPLVLAMLAGIIMLLMPRIPGGRMPALSLIAVLVCWQPTKLEQGEFELNVLDVGMGTSVMLRTRNHSLVYDLGPGSPGAFNAVDWALLPGLRQAGIDTPDLLIVSHVDQDHSGGLYSFRDPLQMPRLVSGTPGELKSKFTLRQAVRSCHGYPGWRWDGVDFRFLGAAVQAAGSNRNNRSCILLIDGHHDALLPGDIEASQESRLLSKHAAELDADILLAPHHGSKTSSSGPFLRQVTPKHVVFTMARNNRWKFPADEVVARYNVIGALQYRSDRDGAVRMTSRAAGLDITVMRNPVRRIWRRW